MKRADVSFTLDWCLRHRCWYVGDCPNCMTDSVAEDKDKEIATLKDTIRDMENTIEELEDKIE